MSATSLKSSSHFPPCPAPGNLPLPFAIDEMDFSVWLNSLSSSEDMEKCRTILEVLQTLNNAYPPERKLIPGRTRLFFLGKLNATLTSVTTVLTHFPTFPDVTKKSEENEQQKMGSELSVWSTLELSNAYTLLVMEDWFKENDYYSLEEKTTIIANGIQALGRALLYISQTYCKPYVYFWHKCFQFYRLARLYRLNENEANPNAQVIENGFKRLLVFSLSNSNQFSPTEMRTIYELLGHYASYTSILRSVPKKKFKGIPFINLRGSGQPMISDEDVDENDPDLLYIATVTVASKILEATNDRRTHHLPTDRLMLLRLAKTLTLNEQRKDSRVAAHDNHIGIIGFDNNVEFLRTREIQKQNALAEIGKFDPARPGELRDLDLEIEMPEPKADDLGFGESLSDSNRNKNQQIGFKVIEFTNPSDIWKSAPKNETHESNIRLLDKSEKGFGLLWTDTMLGPKVGSIIGVMNKSLNVGLIRWLARSKETGMFMGVELLGKNATVVKVTNPGFPDDMVTAIFFPKADPLKQTGSLILLNKGFRPSEFIFIYKNHRNVRYRLTKQLHLTSYINHVEVIRSN